MSASKIRMNRSYNTLRNLKCACMQNMEWVLSSFFHCPSHDFYNKLTIQRTITSCECSPTVYFELILNLALNCRKHADLEAGVMHPWFATAAMGLRHIQRIE